MKIIIETERLLLREFTPDDTTFIIELLNSPGWLKYIGNRNVKTEDDAKQYLLKGPLRSYVENGYGLSMVEIKQDHIPIGMCGIIKRDAMPHPDIGFAFLPAFTGRGYAFEIVTATLDYAKKQLKLPQVCAFTQTDNADCIRLLAKAGMSFQKTTHFPGEATELMLFVPADENHKIYPDFP